MECLAVASDMPRDGGASSRCSKDDETCTMTHAPAVEEDEEDDEADEGTPWYRERLWRMAQPAHDGTPSSSACIQLPPRGTPERAEAVHTFNAFFRKDRANAQLALSKSRCHMATRHNRPEHLETLITRSREDYNKPDLEGVAPIHIAAREGYVECLRILLRAKAAVDDADDKFGFTPIMYAVQTGRVCCLKMLIDAGGLVSKTRRKGKGQSPGLLMQIAIFSKKVKCLRVLIDAGVSVDMGLKKTLNHRSVNIDMTKRHPGWTPLHLAAIEGHLKSIEILINAGANVDISSPDNGKTPIHFAAEEGHATALQTLIDAGADVNAKDDAGATPAMIAARRGHRECVKVIVGTCV